MKAASIAELKQEMKNLGAKELLELCLRLARFKKENKELLTFLLFESNDIEGYITSVKQYISDEFKLINRSNVHFIKKSIRKILRNINKFIRYAASDTVEVELLIHFCETFKSNDIPVKKSVALMNLYEGQLKKLNKSILLLHEDLQYDFVKRLEKIETIKTKNTIMDIVKGFLTTLLLLLFCNFSPAQKFTKQVSEYIVDSAAITLFGNVKIIDGTGHSSKLNQEVIIMNGIITSNSSQEKGLLAVRIPKMQNI